MRMLAILLGGLFSVMALAKPVPLDDVSRQEIAERIAPVGSVCKEGEDCAANVGAVAAAPSEPRSGETVFNKFCTACHTSGLLGAPKKGDTAEWTKRASAIGGYSKLLQQAYAGIGSMPPKGTCMNCSEEEFGNAMLYMGAVK
ncbi:cytochrome C [Endozoicomonas montiporae]|uniref:Cytochrome C n=2 Tax=Endozoicomonas montiporae TaxID=1027273 RepID=A0A081N3M4_9GAMM|nr:cytochrome C [Endozoicomonas montiporae]